MNKPEKMATANELLEILDGLWVDKKGIMAIAYCGNVKAGSHMKNIRDQVKEKYGKDLPKGLVPTEEVISYFNINLNLLKKTRKE